VLLIALLLIATGSVRSRWLAGCMQGRHS